MVDLFLGQPVGRVLDALAPLVPHHVLLVGEHLLVELVEQEAHPITLQPQRQLELIGRQVLEIVGAIETGGAVHERCAGALEVLEVHVLADVTRALEHHVLEQVGETGAARGLLGRADVIPNIHADDGEAAVLVEDHLETVRELVLLVVELHLGGLVAPIETA